MGAGEQGWERWAVSGPRQAGIPTDPLQGAGGGSGQEANPKARARRPFQEFTSFSGRRFGPEGLES